MTDLKFPRNLVSVEWLQEHLQNEKVVVLDASWHLPAKERSGYSEWKDARIPGAGFFDYDCEIKDQEVSLPRMLPGEDLFSEAVRKLGVNNDSLVVVYDANAMFSSCRAWWMFRAMGHEQVAVLDGGLLAWQDAGYPVTNGSDSLPSMGDFEARKNDRFIDADHVRRKIPDKETVILDVRSSDRFAAGHMPGAKNLPYGNVLQDGKMKSTDELKGIFSELVDEGQNLLCTCGSGVTACIIALAAEHSGRDNIVVYDASWTEWGAEGGGFPVEGDS